MTDNEIIKAFECCLKEDGADCNKCPYDDYCSMGDSKILKDAHDLITSQQEMVKKSENVEHFADKTIATLQAENERLKVENQSLIGSANSLKMHYEEAQAEIDELRKGFIANADYFASEYDKNIKSEAVKEFAWLVKANKRKLFNYIYSSKGFDEQIDNLVKEMVYM